MRLRYLVVFLSAYLLGSMGCSFEDTAGGPLDPGSQADASSQDASNTDGGADDIVSDLDARDEATGESVAEVLEVWVGHNSVCASSVLSITWNGLADDIV